MHRVNKCAYNNNWIKTIPQMTVVVSCLNKQYCLRETITLLRKSFIKNHKIIIVNDGSTDNSQKIINTIPVDKVIINETTQGWGAANNAALECVDTEFVVFMDADCLLGSYGWLEQWYVLHGKEDFGEYGEIHYAPDIWRFKGVKKFILTRSWLNNENKYTADLRAFKNDILTVGHVGGNFKIYRTDTLKSIGGFENDLYVVIVEVAISLKMKAHGKKIASYRIPYRHVIIKKERKEADAINEIYELYKEKIAIQKTIFDETHALLISTYNYGDKIVYKDKGLTTHGGML